MTEDGLARHWSLTTQDMVEVLRARGTEHRLRCAVQLCTLRATGRFVADYRRVPAEAVNHLAAQLGLDPLLSCLTRSGPRPRAPNSSASASTSAGVSSTPLLSKDFAPGCRTARPRA